MTDERRTGIILSADIDGRGFGFIKSPGFEKDLFYHVHSLASGQRGVAEGQQVSFVPVINGTKGWKATDIRVEGDAPIAQIEVQVDRTEKRSLRYDGN